MKSSKRGRSPKGMKISKTIANIILMSSAITQIYLLKYFFEGGEKHNVFLPKVWPGASIHRRISVDILSIGSQERLDYVNTQKKTFASHKIVRSFYSVTELDDADPLCAKKLTKRDVADISNFCRTKAKWNRRRQFLMTYLKSAYARERFLMKKSNPQGWVCAQTRPTQGIYKVLQTYKAHNKSFPDFLIIMDDDTYYNMKLFEDHFSNLDSSESHAIAGCRVRSPTNKINWTFAFGGYGLVVSKGWLRRMVRPIVCPRDTNYCRFIRQTNHIGEREVFRSGMTLADLSYAYTIHQPFADYRNWTTGFCLHSDWLLGYITNFYNVSRHVTDKDYAKVPQARLDAYLDSEINSSSSRQGGRRLCDFLRGNCHSMAHICHYSNPAEMTAITRIVQNQNPEEFKTMLNDCAGCNKDGFLRDHSTPVVDFFSFAHNVTDLLAQKEVVGSHKLIRQFFTFSALDNGDPSCHGAGADPIEVIKVCESKKKGTNRSWLLAGLRSPHSLGKDSSPSWVCEQRMLVRAVSDAVGQYKTTEGTNDFPDYLILADSRSYWNLDVFIEMLRNIELEVQNGMEGSLDASVPLVIGGCVREYKVFKKSFFFRVPLLSHGIILNRGILDSLLTPLYCNATLTKDPRCQILEESQVLEGEIFRQGMTPFDLIRGASTNRVLGVCLEGKQGNPRCKSHHLPGISNVFGSRVFYAGTKSSTLPLHEGLAPSNNTVRIYLKSIAKRSGPEMLCRYREANCNADAPYCSSISADQMLTYTRH